MASPGSKIWKFFLRPIYRTKSRVSTETNIKLSRTIVFPIPPKRIYKKNHVRISQVQGRNLINMAPKSLKNNKVVYYLHGGGYFTGITLPHWWFISKLARKSGTRFAVIDYPLAPEYSHAETFPVVKEGYKTLLREFEPSQIIFMGDSAGGGLALALAQDLKTEKLPQPESIFLLSPWLDITMSNPDIKLVEKDDVLLSKDALIEIGKLYAKDSDSKDNRISPIYGDLNGLAEIYLFIGSYDIAVADARKLNILAKNNNIKLNYFEYDKMVHVWLFLPIPEAKTAMNEIAGLINQL